MREVASIGPPGGVVVSLLRPPTHPPTNNMAVRKFDWHFLTFYALHSGNNIRLVTVRALEATSLDVLELHRSPGSWYSFHSINPMHFRDYLQCSSRRIHPWAYYASARQYQSPSIGGYRVDRVLLSTIL
jgi:hypothetical protein